MRLAIGVCVVCVCVGIAANLLAQTPQVLNEKTRALVESLEKALTEYERTANELEKELEQFAKTDKLQVVVALDCVRLQLLSIRSVRQIIRQQPSYLQHHIGLSNLLRWKEGAEYFLAAAKANRDPFVGMASGVRPFRSKIDDQLLLYKISLPKDYDSAQRKYPLRIELHAGGGFSWLAYWVNGKPDTSARAFTNDGAIHVSPAGRQHIGMGEVAVLEAIADVKKHYAVDEDRVTIGGASWGGTGGFHFATFLPDQFSAAHSLTGGGNYNLPVKNGRFDAYMLPDNLANLPFLIWDAPADGHYAANHAFTRQLQELGNKYPGHYPHLELTDPHGGHGVIDKKLLEQGREWIARQVRNPFPRTAIFKTHWLRYDGAYWARIDTTEQADQPARIEARLEQQQQQLYCHVALENVDRFHLHLDKQLVGAAADVLVSVNDGQPLSTPSGKTTYFWKGDRDWRLSAERYPRSLVKKRGLSGPIQDVFMEHPVLMVYGETTTEEKLDAIIDRLISTGDGSGYLRTGFARKKDQELTSQEIEERNLVVVGTPRQNRFLAKMAEQLPVVFTEDGFKIAGKEYRGHEASFAMIYPNPLNPERYLLLVPEVYEGSRPWDYPDWVVFQARTDKKTPARVLASGLFDSKWKMQ